MAYDAAIQPASGDERIRADVSPDGSVLLYTRATGPSVDLWYVSLGADRTPHPFVQTLILNWKGTR